jgi:hypothetical protein
MPQYLVAIHHPDNYDPSLEGEEMVRDIDMLNKEMEAAGARSPAGRDEMPGRGQAATLRAAETITESRKTPRSHLAHT